MKKYLFLFPLLSVSMLCSCVDDEGNYDYTAINEVTIGGDTTPLTALSYIDRVVIRPEISGTLYGEDLDNYEFCYTLCYDDHTHIVIGTEKDLDWLADVKPGTYSIYLSVKDKANGVEKITPRPYALTVKSSFSTGFLVLGENMETGHSQVDMLAMVANRDTVLIPDVFDSSEVVLHDATKILFTGEIDAYLGASYKDRQNLWVMTSHSAYQFTNGDSFELMSTLEDADILDPTVTVEHPMRLVDLFPHQTSFGTHRSRQYRGYITNDMLYYGGINYGDYHTEPINRYSPNSRQYFKPAPYMFYSQGYYSTLQVFLGYDLDNDRFFRLPSNVNSYTVKYVYDIVDYDTDPWKYNANAEDMPRTIVYGENTWYGTNGTSYAIMKEKQGVNYFIYKLMVPPRATDAVEKELFFVTPDIVEEFAKASHYAFSSIRSALFFSVGNRLYQYDFSYGKYIYLDFDDEITYICSDVVSDGEKDEFFVATYGDVAKGTIYKYTHGDNPNTLDFRLMNGEKWHTDLKVTDITWKDAN